MPTTQSLLAPNPDFIFLKVFVIFASINNRLCPLHVFVLVLVHSLMFSLFFPNQVPVTANILIPKGRVYSVGSDISLYCNVTGEPTPDVTWYKDNRPLEVSDHVEIPGMQYSGRNLLCQVTNKSIILLQSRTESSSLKPSRSTPETTGVWPETSTARLSLLKLSAWKVRSGGDCLCR